MKWEEGWRGGDHAGCATAGGSRGVEEGRREYRDGEILLPNARDEEQGK